jgi:hypothetical protein
MANNTIFKFGTVISVDDELDGGRVRVHIKGDDPSVYKKTDIPYAFPLLPKHLNIKPQVGEMVFVFRQYGDGNDERFFIGPIISQPHKFGSDTITPDALIRGGSIGPDAAPSTDPENNGLQPNDEDVSIIGRGSTDIIQKKNELQIRFGKSADLKKFNRENISYLQLKYDERDKTTHTNVVSNKINLLTHGGVKNFDLTNPKSLITNEEYQKILETAQKMALGTKLVEFLELQRQAFASHVHPYHGMPPDSEQNEIKNYLNFDLNSVLSENILVN